jgi:hypothetical protein
MTTTKTHSELLLEEYFVRLKIQFQYEPEVPGKKKRPDFLIKHGNAEVWLEVKEFEAPAPMPTSPFDPLPPIIEKIDQARKKFKEFKSCACGLVLHSCTSVYRNTCLDVVLAAMLGGNSVCEPLSIDYIEDAPYRFRFFGNSALSHDRNTTIGAVVILQHWQVNELWVDVRNELLNRQAKGEKILPGADLQLLAERQDEPIQVTYPNTTRCVVLENPHAHIAFPRDLFNGPFDQRWGINGDDYTLLWMGSELHKLRQRSKPVPFMYL